MRTILFVFIMIATALSGADALSGAAPRVVSTTVQSGFADTFQLTLGGVFGRGPAWHNRVAINTSNVMRSGDVVSITGFVTTDLDTGRNDWTAALGYRTRLLRHNTHQLSVGTSVERWRFPSVLKGTQDWLWGYQAAYSTSVRGIPVAVQANGWTLLDSSLPKGSLIHTTMWFSHPLREARGIAVTLRHGPQHTYSWGFYGTRGNRIVRYAGALVLSHAGTSVEIGYRQQLGLQPRIPDNRLWHATLSRTF